MSVIINEQQLKEEIHKNKYAIIDVRTKSNGFATGKEAYESSHLPGAVFLDRKLDLTGVDSFMPDVYDLAKKLGQFGITENTPIVLYDQGNHRAASKAWYVLSYLGHEQLFILDGGYKAWTDAGNEVTDVLPKHNSVTYKVNIQADLLVDIEKLKERLDDKLFTLIDSRAPDRYAGEVEPTYNKAGHIPGAINYHAQAVFEEGLFKSPDELQKHFKHLSPDEEIIVSCGSGNSACLNVVALKEAGFENIKLYPGGFSEWIKDDANEVRQGNGEQN